MLPTAVSLCAVCSLQVGIVLVSLRRPLILLYHSLTSLLVSQTILALNLLNGEFKILQQKLGELCAPCLLVTLPCGRALVGFAQSDSAVVLSDDVSVDQPKLTQIEDIIRLKLSVLDSRKYTVAHVVAVFHHSPLVVENEVCLTQHYL